MKPIIPFDTFAATDLQIGKITDCVRKEGSEKLLRLTVDFGSEQRTIFTGLAQFYPPEEFIGKSFLFIVNLEPRKMMDEFSEGMLLCADADPKPIPLVPTEEVPPGTTLR